MDAAGRRRFFRARELEKGPDFYPSTPGQTVKVCFTLPPTMCLVAPGRVQPCLAGCVLIVDTHGRVELVAPSRTQAFAQLTRFLKPLIRDLPDLVIEATVETSGVPWSGRDSWSIVVNAELAFVPTKLPVEVVGRDG